MKNQHVSDDFIRQSVVRSNNVSLKDGYQTHKEQLNNQVKYSLNIKQNNKSLLEFVVIAMINKKTRQRVVSSIGKIGIGFHLSHSFVF